MLGKLILRIGLKACLPLLALVGMLSYGVYMKGGDPGAVWRNALASTSERLTGRFRHGADATTQALQSVPPISSGDRANTSVYTWKDAKGVTHYSSTPPDQSAPTSSQPRLVTVDNRTNVLAAPQSTRPSPPPTAPTTTTPGQESLFQLQQQLSDRVGPR